MERENFFAEEEEEEEEKTLDRSIDLYRHTVMVEKRRSNEEIESEKTTKKMKNDGDGEGGGGINSLPDSILHHVLCFLSMKQAIQTSLVSKRWRYLWTCISTLNFINTKRELMEFVDAVLILRDNSSNIQRFSITDASPRDYYSDSDSNCSSSSSSSSSFDDDYYDDDDYSDYESDESVYFSDSNHDQDYGYDYAVKNPILRLNRWILTAVRCNVEEIHVEFLFNKRVKLPNCLFTCNSLRKLELISLDREPHELVLPDSINLPQLEILHLDGLSLHHEDDHKINSFISLCCSSSLTHLTLKKCGIHRKNLYIVAPNLKHLVINEFVNKKSLQNQSMKHNGVTGSVRISAPNLISFLCKDYLSKSYYLENTSSLVEACVDMKVSAQARKEARLQEKGRNEMVYGEKIDFRILHNVKHLQLNAWALQIFIATYGLLDSELSDSGFTEFQNLRSLKLQTWLSGECIRGITWLLNITHHIVELSLKIIEDTISPVLPHWDAIQLNSSDIGDYWKLPLQSEEHTFYDHLSKVEIRGLKGRVNELKFLEVLLKNAVVLEKLILVFCLANVDRDRERQLIKYSEILHSFPKASPTVKIFFISS